MARSPAYSSTVPSLLNGVSTQAASLRLSSQGDIQINAYSTLTKGLIKRPPSLHIKNLGAVTNAGNAHIHMINRDQTERYIVVATNGDLKVFDLQGNAKTVNFPNGKTYLTNSDPKAGLSMITVADYTFIVNRATTVAMSTATSPTRGNEALVNVMAGNYSRQYSVALSGTTRARYNTPDGSNRTHYPNIDTNNIAKILEYLLRNSRTSTTANITQSWNEPNGNKIIETWAYSSGDNWNGSEVYGTGYVGSTAGWAVTRYASVLHITKSTSPDFTISVEDGFNGNAMKAFKNATQRFSDLPTVAPDGYTVEITGESTNNFDNYFVKFNATKKVWEETIKPGTTLGFDMSTMPHVLVREADGTFTFKQASWENRRVGDENSSPDPGFVGQKIQDVFFWRNRLGFVAGENVSLSEAGEFFSFWPRTLTTVLDSDPIDVGPSHPKVTTFRYAHPFSGDLILFGENVQMRLTGGELLSPKSASMKLLGEYNANAQCRPASAANLLFWPSNDNARSLVRELWIESDGTIQKPNEANSHCPDFVPTNIYQMDASSDLNMLISLSSTHPNRLYVYKYYWQGNEKPQASWSYWDLGVQILGAKFMDTDLYLLVLDGSDTRVLRIPCQVDYVDPNMEFALHLDQRVELAVGTYDSTTDRTSYTMPYTVPANIQAWTGYSALGAYKPGHKLLVNSYTGTTLRLAGDTRNEKIYAGRPFTMQYRFSPFLIRESRDTGSPVTVSTGRTQILRVGVAFVQSAYFKLEVSPENRAKTSYSTTVNAYSLDDPNFKTNEVILEEGKFSVPVKAENTRVAIDIVNDSALPSGFVSAEWSALWHSHTRRI